MTYKIGFIGCGNMGGALAIAAAKSLPAEKIAVYDPDKNKALSLADKFDNIAAAEELDLVSESQFIFIGVKPQMLETCFNEIRPYLQERKDAFTLVSMAAGTSIEKIEKLAAVDCAVIRIMPNTSVAIGKGVVLYCANKKGAGSVPEFLNCLRLAGVLDRIDENKIDAASAVSGCGPAYVYMFIEALADGAVEIGIPRDKALTYAAAMVSGAAENALTSGVHPEALKDAVCSPGGTTIAGVHALENKAFRSAVSDAVVAAYEKTLKLK